MGYISDKILLFKTGILPPYNQVLWETYVSHQPPFTTDYCVLYIDASFRHQHNLQKKAFNNYVLLYKIKL
jgi:hypothetical protein